MAAARESRASSTRELRPFSARQALTAANAFSGSSVARDALHSGDTNVNEQPLNGLHRQGKALAGVASSISMVIIMLRWIIPITRCCSVQLLRSLRSGTDLGRARRA